MDGNSSAQEVFLSNGSIVKQDGKVLQELANNLKKPSNVSCRVEKFGNVVDGFCQVKRNWVAEMGFEALLNLVGCRLPRSLCYWLATCVDCSTKELVLEGVKFPLSKVQVNCVYGIPFGPNAVPNKIKGKRMQKLEKDLWEYFSASSGSGIRAISGQCIIDALDLPAEDEHFFKRAFLMFALNELICPTTCYRLSTKLIPAVLVYARANEYDWCSLLLDHLFVYLARFAKTFDRQGFVAGCGGCTHFLAVFYLDRLKRSPVSWGVYPRIKVWRNKEVNKAISDDRVPNGDFGRLGWIDVAYGEPHPAEARDSFPKHVVGDKSTGVEDRVAHRYYMPPSPKYKRKKRQKATNGNPYIRKINKRRREAGLPGNEEQELVAHNIPPPRTPIHEGTSSKADKDADVMDGSATKNQSENNYIHTSCSTESPNNQIVDRVLEGIITDYCPDDGEDYRLPYTPPYRWGTAATEGCCTECNSSSSVPQVSYTSYDDDSDADNGSYMVVSLSPPPGFQTPLRTCSVVQEVPDRSVEVKSIQQFHTADQGSLFRSPTTLKKSLEKSRKQRVVRSSVKLSSQYIDNWRPSSYRGLKNKLAKVILKSLNDPMFDPVVLDCGGCSVLLSSAAGVISAAGRVDAQYVAAVAKLNTLVWAEKSRGRSKKIMFTPSFAHHVLYGGDEINLSATFCEQHADELAGCVDHKINVIFVPVQQHQQWWTIAFSFNREETRVLDPCGQKPVDVMGTIDKLIHGLGALLAHVFPTWQVPCISSWKLEFPQYLQVADNMQSGVAMLYSVKQCEDRFKTTFSGVLNFKERAWLLCEDLMSKHNKARSTVQDLIR